MGGAIRKERRGKLRILSWPAIMALINERFIVTQPYHILCDPQRISPSDLHLMSFNEHKEGSGASIEADIPPAYTESVCIKCVPLVVMLALLSADLVIACDS
jgi:hypothetical protein